MRYTALIGLFALACRPDYVVLGENDTSLGEEEVDAVWDTATLLINHPQSGDFLPWEQDNDFEAVIVDAEGNELEFDEVTWSSDIDEGWALTGRALTDDALDVGTHAITAQALLPNGDRLTYTVGGVLVQSEYAGTYTGTLRVDLISDQISTACSGSAAIVVDVYGEVVEGDANCFLSIQGFDLDGAYLVAASNDDGDMSGEIQVDLAGFFQIPMDLDGSLSEEGELSGTFSGDLLGYAQIEGLLSATRISRDTSL